MSGPFWGINLFFLCQDKNHLTAISGFQKDILSTLSTYYYTFVDVMEFKDITNEVITSLATSQFFFDIVSGRESVCAYIIMP